MLRVGNFVPSISLEGFEGATDGRRGDGVYRKVIKAMELLRREKQELSREDGRIGLLFKGQDSCGEKGGY